MGFPHHPNPRETTVLSQHFGDPEARTLDGWKKRGGYKALEKALGMQPADIVNVVKESGLRGRGGAAICAATPTSRNRARSRTAS